MITPAPRAELFPHGADIGIYGIGLARASAFDQAAIALTTAVTGPAEIIPKTTVEVTCEAPHDGLLLVERLNALTFAMSARRLIFSRLAVSVTGRQRHGQAWGEPIDPTQCKPTTQLPQAVPATSVHRFRV